MADLADVIITGELARRPSRPPDFAAEGRAMVALARAMAEAPETVLQRLVEVAVELTKADAAGVSLLEEDQGKAVFRRHAMAGVHAAHVGATAPRDFSPSGIVLDRAAPQLFAHPGRAFPYLDQTEPGITEALLLPFWVGGRAVGTIWLLAHSDARRFDAQDVRLMTDLGEFGAAAYEQRVRASELLEARAAIGTHAADRRTLEDRSRSIEPRAEAAATDSDRRFAMLVQNVRDFAIFLMDTQGRVTAWNEGAARLKGYTAEEIIGQHFSVFFTPEDRQIGMPEYEKGMAAAHDRYEGEGWRVRKDGSQFWGNEIIAAVRDDDGRLVGFTKVARDLTERKSMENALRVSEERYRLLVENIRDYAVFTLDPDGKIASWNPGAERVFGYAEAEILGKPGTVLFTPEDNATGETAKELATALAEGRASDDRWQTRKSGEQFWASGVTAVMRDESGALRGFAKVCRDLTSQKTFEEQREHLLEQEKVARMEAEQAMAARDEFLAVVSHELRTPLTVVLLWTKMLRAGDIKEQDRPQVVETIAQSAEAQRRLIDDLLDVSRMTSGKLRLHVRETDLAVIALSAIEALRPMAEAKGVRVDLSVEGPGVLRADPDRMQQVCWNLVNNAVKFTDRGGRVNIRLTRGSGAMRIEVADTGIGITPAFLPSVFELFRQADGSLTRTVGGLGLGLSICKKLVELHGGTINAASPGEGKGSVFTVELPAPERSDLQQGSSPGPGPAAALGAAAAVADVPFTPAPVLAGVRVLLVENETHTRTAISWLLEQCGAEVTAVDAAEPAITAFQSALEQRSKEGGFDVLVSDIGMPVEDGYSLIKRVRGLGTEKGGEIPAIALTAYARAEDRIKAVAAGFTTHVGKPVEPLELVSVVADAARRRRKPDERR